MASPDPESSPAVDRDRLDTVLHAGIRLGIWLTTLALMGAIIATVVIAGVLAYSGRPL